jgi:hypothetical protein
MTLPPAGGPNMPPKVDPHDFTTPSGRMPVVIPRGLWDEANRQGWDMRWYVVLRPIPITETPT